MSPHKKRGCFVHAFGPVYEAVRESFRRFRERTGGNAVDYLVERIPAKGSTIYQWGEADGDDARRNISVQSAILVTNTLNAHYVEHGLPKDFTILRSACAAVGACLVEPPQTLSVEATLPKTLDEFNQFVQAFAAAWADGRLDPDEELRVNREAHELIAAVLAMTATPTQKRK